MAPSAASDKAQSTPSKAGITTTADGKRVIPSSVRADGSARREIRVRAGYVPPEDVEIYQNRRAEAWKNRGSGGVPGAEPVEEPKSGAANSNKNSKRRAARKRAKETATDGATPSSKGTDAETDANAADTTTADNSGPVNEEAEKDKKAKAIRKKIRQANELKSRREEGETLLPEQLEKIIKMSELVRQLKALGFEE